MPFHPVSGLTSLLSAHGLIAYPVFFLGAYFEILLPLSFFIPGEIFFYSAGALAALGTINIWIVSALLIIGSILGDITNFFIGVRHAKDLEAYLEKRHATRKIFERGKAFFDKHGQIAVFFGRFIGLVAEITAFSAGASGMRFRRYIAYAVPSIALAVGMHIAIGYGLGVGYETLSKAAGKALSFIAIAPPVIIVLLIIFGPSLYGIYARRKKRSGA